MVISTAAPIIQSATTLKRYKTQYNDIRKIGDKMSDKNSIGKSGEFFAAGELERRGFTCALTMANTKEFDILAINKKNHKQYAIQVKTTRYKNKHWIMDKKNENIFGDNIFYILVSLNELDTPEFHIVPSSVLSKEIKEEHQLWLKTPGKQGQPHKDNNRRTFRDENDIYLNKWEYIK